MMGRWEKSWFDLAHQHFVVLKNNAFYIWTPGDDKGQPLPFYHEPNLPNDVLLAKISLDMQLIAVQMSGSRLMVFDISNLSKWTIEIKSPQDNNRILMDGLIWSEHGGNSQDLIIVTVRGLEMYKISSQRNQCKLSRTITQGISQHICYWYEPNHRMMLLASPFKLISSTGDGTTNTSSSSIDKGKKATGIGLALNGYFFRSDKSDLPKLELPPPDKTPRFDIGPGVGEGDVALATLYGQLYCIVHCISTSVDQIALFLVTKTAVTRTHTLVMSLMSRTVSVSVSDNLLFVHCISVQVFYYYYYYLNNPEALIYFKIPT